MKRLEAAQAELLALGDAAPERACTRIGSGDVHHLSIGAGPPVVLLHGAGGGAANWYRLFGRLGERRRILAPDLPGFGFSSPVPLRAPLGSCAADVIERWLDELAVPACDVIGTSFGALIGARLAQRGRATRLVVIDAVGLGSWLPWPVRAACTSVGGRLLLRRQTRSGTRVMLRSLLTSNRLDPIHERALVAWLHAAALADESHYLERALHMFGGWRGQAEVLSDEELRALRVPTLIVWGGRDRFAPVAHAQRAARLLPHARLAVIPDSGHSPNWERPARLADLVMAFLDSAPAWRAGAASA